MPFQTTLWELIELIRAGQPEAMNEFARRYREPVVAFICRQGFDVHDAEDLSQEVFCAIVRHKLLDRADPTRGKLRSLLLAVTRHLIGHAKAARGTLKRGGASKLVSLEAGWLPSDAEDAGDKDEFKRLWMERLLGIAIDRLRSQRGPHFEVIERYLKGESYESIGKAIGRSVKDVDNLLYAAKQKLIRLVRKEIALYSRSAQEGEEELRELSQFLKERGSGARDAP